jgi:hypothetical protein
VATCYLANNRKVCRTRTHWSDRRFEHLLSRMEILDEWPRTPSGLLSTEDDDVFKPMAMRYPSLAPLRDLRSTLMRLNKLELPVGQDGRDRGSLAPYRSVTGRNYPPTRRQDVEPGHEALE